jgi:hypothetical protein
MNTCLPLPAAARRAAGLPALVMLLSLAPLAARAADEPPRHSGPPPEALQACKDKQAEAACTFTGPRGSMEGSCFAPQGKPLACRPAGAPPMRPDGERTTPPDRERPKAR